MEKKLKGECKIIPIVIDDCESPPYLQTTIWQKIENLENYDKEFERIINAIDEDSFKTKIRDKNKTHTKIKSPDEIIEEFVEILENCEDLNMSDPKRREFLLRRFSQLEKNLLKENRHLTDMHIDLYNIVEYADKHLNKLNLLVEEAMKLSLNQKTKNQLKAFLEKL